MNVHKVEVILRQDAWEFFRLPMCLVGDAGGNHHTSKHMGTLFWGT